MNIIIADTNKQMRKNIIEIFSDITLKIKEVDNESSFFETIKNFIPDLILLDVKLPDTGGIEIYKKLKINVKLANIPVIFLAEKITYDEQIICFKAGAVDYIEKTGHKDIFKAKITTFLKLKNLQDTLYNKNQDLIHITNLIKKYLPVNLQEEIFEKAVRKLTIRKKHLTIFFSDIREFTNISSKYSPEQVIDLLNFYLYVVYKIILTNHGKIDKVMGDGILAIFEDIEDEFDSCYQAIKAALEIQKEMKSFNKLMKESPKFSPDGEFKEIKIAIGINYDEVVQGNLGTPDKMDYTIIGDGVNMADRCQKFATEGGIIITEAVYSHIKDKVNVEILPPTNVKGKKEKFQFYKVKSLN